jgi:hypothetical protein
VLARASEHVDTFDAIGEITLTKGKDPDPSTTQLQLSRDAAVLMLGAKENYSWDSWKTRARSWSNIPY